MVTGKECMEQSKTFERAHRNLSELCKYIRTIKHGCLEPHYSARLITGTASSRLRRRGRIPPSQTDPLSPSVVVLPFHKGGGLNPSDYRHASFLFKEYVTWSADHVFLHWENAVKMSLQ